MDRFLGIRAKQALRLLLGAVALTLATNCGSGAKATDADGAPAATTAIRKTQVGVNISRLSYWGGTYMFLDIARQSGPLATPKDGWVKASDVFTLNAAGWPPAAPVGTDFILPLIRSVAKAPPGPWDCSVSPGFALRAFGEATLKPQGKHYLLYPKENATDISIIARQESKDAELRTLSCLLPDATAPDAPNTFNPAFLADIKPFAVLRFMDLMATNNAPPPSWAERTTPTSFTQSGDRGMALENMIDLANKTGAAPWFTLPWGADAAYVRQFAQMVRERLNPRLKIYVELSNEVWNTMFAQSKQSTTEGVSRRLEGTPYDAGQRNYADKAVAMFAVWEQVFGKDIERVVRVLGTQNGNVGLAELLLSRKGVAGHVDALAVAPYFYADNLQSPPGSDRMADEVFTLGHSLVDSAITGAVQVKAVANRHHVRLIAYEGGAHFWSPGDPVRAADFDKVKHDPRMADLYVYYLDQWQKNVGDLIVLYSATSSGTFGMNDYTGQPLSEAPKMRGTLEFINRK